MTRRETLDGHMTVHLWLEQSSAELRARLRSPLFVDEPTAVGLDQVQAMIAQAVADADAELRSAVR